MRTSVAFVLGAIMGAAWCGCGDGIEEYVGEKTRGMRTKAEEGLRAVEQQAGKVLHRGGAALHRADDFLQDTKEHVSGLSGPGRRRFIRRPQREKDDQEDSVVKPVTLIGVALIILGVLALAYQGITYTTREKVLDLGPLKASVDKEKRIPLPPIVGVLALAGGVVLVIVGARRS